MATHAVALGASISTAIAAGAAGDTYTFAAGTYRGQTFTPKVGDIYIGNAGGTTLCGASLVTSWTNISANWYKATQGTIDTGTANFPAPVGTLWQGTATISGTTLTIASTTSGTFTANGNGISSNTNGASLFGNGLSTSGITVVSGSGSTWTLSVSQTVSVARPMILISQSGETVGNGAFPNDAQAFLGEELFVDGARYTRIQAGAVSASNGAAASAPGANQWYWDFATSSVNINLASPTSHTIEYSQTRIMCNMGQTANFTMKNLTISKYAGTQTGAILTFPYGILTLENVNGTFNKGAAVNLGGGILNITGGKFTDNGWAGLVGSPSKGTVQGAEIARNNQALLWNNAWAAAGIKLVFASQMVIINNNVHDNGGPGIWFDIASYHNDIGYNTVANNGYAGIMYEISFYANIFNNTISGSGQNDSGHHGSGIYISTSSGLDIWGNNVTVLTGNLSQIGGGINLQNAARGSTSTNAMAVLTASVSGSVLTVTATSANIYNFPTYLYGPGVIPGTQIAYQLTGTTGSTGTYQLDTPHPTIGSTTMYAAQVQWTTAYECRNCRVHDNIVTYLDAAGATDGYFVNQAITGGSNIYRDFNTYYTPNSTGTFWNHGTDAAVNTNYTFAAYQTAGFELNSTNVVGVAPTAPTTGFTAYPNPRFPRSFGAATVSALSVATVTTGGAAVTAIAVNGRTAGGEIRNPETATANLGINEIGTASGTSSNGSTIFIAPGTTYYLSPSANAVSVISADSAHPFSGIGLT